LTAADVQSPPAGGRHHREPRRGRGRDSTGRADRRDTSSTERSTEDEPRTDSVHASPGAPTVESEAASDTADEKENGEKTPRKWTPPEPTVERTSTAPRAGWWQRRS
jgi:hypothetical protein